ncbi:hypothetical protein [Peribacillus alkalitolerans]|uniref:hypothetical protein n=1 Tax=Peribacillus alkalitolerans TaxID=1550385 RepID=UPI0013D2EF30|nr:hypothetical protein [Peribacillus alkalitolerans]
MGNQADLKEIIENLQQNPPKFIGGYKKQGWAIKALEKISDEEVEESTDNVTVKGILEAKDGSFYPAFLTLDLTQKGLVSGIYLLAEDEDQFNLIPFEIAKEVMDKSEGDLIPFKYRTMEPVAGDEYQKNWPDFT